MDYSFKPIAFALFCMITLITLSLSVIASRRVRTAGQFYVAGGGVKWFVNGIAFAGDYLSAASFLGIAGYDPFGFVSHIISSPSISLANGKTVTGEVFMSPGLKFKNPLDFASLALALILGTAALPHILIRYYTVPSPADARKSTVIAIVAIGIFYILTLFLGLGAMYFNTTDPSNENLSAPLLAQFIGGEAFFAVISSIGFAIAASANLPALLCSLFWKRTSSRGIILGIITGLIASTGLIIISPTVMGAGAIFPLSNPGIVSIPLGFLVTIGVSYLDTRKAEQPVSLASG